MLSILARNWWLIALRGILAMLFGILAFAWPGLTLAVLVILFGVYALADGIFNIVASMLHGASSKRWWLLLGGVVSLIVGIMTLAWPGLTALVLVYFIAAWAIVTGIFHILAAFSFKAEIPHEWVLVLSGALSVVFGLLVMLNPGAGALSLIWLIALYAVIYGALLIVLGVRMKSLLGHAPKSEMRHV